MASVFDPAFVQAPEHRPKHASDAELGGIPLVDLSPLRRLNEPTDLQGLLMPQVEGACRDWGFFHVVNHGVPPEVVDRAWAASKRFFDLVLEERRWVRRDEVQPLGYYEAENAKNVRDWKEVFDFVIVTRKPWKSTVAFELLQTIALSLNWPATRLNGYFQEQTGFVRLNYYPPCPSPDLALGVGRHKDSGALTILAQDDVGGLEVKKRSDGEWVSVRPVPNSFVINVGDH